MQIGCENSFERQENLPVDWKRNVVVVVVVVVLLDVAVAAGAQVSLVEQANSVRINRLDRFD